MPSSKPSNSPPRDKTTYHHGDLRRSLLDAALGLVHTHGVQGFTLREAARAAEVSHNAPYRHFPTRASLLVELAIEGQILLRTALQTAVKKCADQRERIFRMGMAYMDFAVTRTAHFRVMFSSEVAHNQTEALIATQAETFDFFEGVLRESQKAGIIRPGDVEQHALVGWSALHGAAMLILDGVFQNTAAAARRNPREISKLVLESLLKGIEVPSAPQ